MTKIDEEPSQIDRLKSLISDGNISSESLAAQIVAYRTLGIGKEISAICMLELAARRAKGDPFEFEKFIETESSKVPKIPNLDIKNLMGNLSLQTISKMMKKK